MTELVDIGAGVLKKRLKPNTSYLRNGYEYATDAYGRLGRVRVRYYWPVTKPADAETGWVRVTTPYSGDGKGQLFTPEIGSQVLVGYEHGLAEFPVILGNLFHAQNKQDAKYTNPLN